MSWIQVEDDVEVTIDLPKGVKSRDISVTMKYNWIKFGLKNGYSMTEKGNKNEERSNRLLRRLLTGLNLYDKIDPDLSSWSLVDGKLVISLAKRDPEDSWIELYSV